MGRRSPGPQGIVRRALDKIDIGTLVRAATPVPGILGFVSVDALARQRNSWTRSIRDLPRSAEEMTAKLGEIYFQTDEHELDLNDRRELSKLCDNLKSLFKEGYRFDLICWGNADHRWTKEHNRELGALRAEAVRSYIIGNVSDSRLRVEAKSLGETNAIQPGGVWKRVPPVLMASERRVDIAVENVVPPVRIVITGHRNWAIALSEAEVGRLGTAKRIQDAWWGGESIEKPLDERVTVLINVVYNVTKMEKEWTADLECTVTDLLKHKELFKATAGIDTDRFIWQKGYRARVIKPKGDKCPPEYYRVIRIIFPGDPEPPRDALRVEGDFPRSEVDDFFDLLPVIYPKLTGMYPSITKRVQEALKPAEAVK